VSKPVDVGVLVGSLRKASITRKVANAVIGLQPPGLHCRVIEIGDLPIYNEDLDDQPPAAWTRFRNEIRGVQAVLFLTPEYNRSIPGCLKNALDVGSRPEGKNVWAGKPAGVISVTPYKLGAFGANHAIRQTFVFLDMPVMQQPEAYIGGADKLFDDAGKLTDDDTRKLLSQFAAAFESWIAERGPTSNFAEFLEQRDAIATAYSNGDAKPLDAIVARQGSASFFPPSGGNVQGAAAVVKRYDTDAKAFAPGSQSSLEILDSSSSGGLGFWTGYQTFDGKIGGQAMKLRIRITELFRLTAGEWKLFHRHASADEPKH